MQLIRHSHEFSQRFGFHLEHYPTAVNFDCLFGSAKLGARLFVALEVVFRMPSGRDCAEATPGRTRRLR
jgi:hypothetical protein